MVAASVLNKIYNYAVENFSDGDFHALVGKSKLDTRSVFERFPDDGTSLQEFVDSIREGQDFVDLMGVFSCYSAFMTKEEAASSLGFTLSEWLEIKKILRW